MYLTKFELNVARRGARALLGSPQSMHAAVLAGFPHGEAGRVLWRVDKLHGASCLYILSPGRPDLTHLVEQAGWPTTHGWRTREYAPLLERLEPGGAFGFRLTANPTRSTRVKEGHRSQRVGHVTAEQQLGWLVSRAERLGFDVGSEEAPTARVIERGVLAFGRRGERVTLATAVFEGSLVVRDAPALRSAITTGIGPAKAYGCGLLTLAPAQASVAPPP